VRLCTEKTICVSLYQACPRTMHRGFHSDSHTRATIGARVTLHTRERDTQTSSTDKRPHFSSHGKREGESKRKMEVRDEKGSARERWKEGPFLSLFLK
jgi:hypothetical protein